MAEAGGIPNESWTEVAGADLSGDQFRFGRIAAGGLVRSALGEDAIGVICEPAGNGEPVGLETGPSVKIEAGAAYAKGDKLMSDANGRAVVAVATAGRHVLGYARTAAAGAGEIQEMRWQPEGILA